MRRKKFKTRVALKFPDYRSRKGEVWDWLDDQLGSVYSDLNPTGQWTMGFIKVDSVEFYEFTFQDPRFAILFKLTWA